MTDVFYYYDAQFRKQMLAMCAAFNWIHVKMSSGGCETLHKVPLYLGTMDRVATAISVGNTSNKPFPLPIITVHLQNVAIDDHQPGEFASVSNEYMPKGGVFPSSMTLQTFSAPVRTTMTFEISLYASNIQQSHQMLEQVYMLKRSFNLFTSDDANDPCRMLRAQYTGTNNESNFPMGADRGVIIHTLSYNVAATIAYPVLEQNRIIDKINLSIGSINDTEIFQLGDGGETIRFTDGGLNTTTVSVE